MTEPDTAARRGRSWWIALAAAVVGGIVVLVALLGQDPAPPRLDGPIGDTPSSEAPSTDRSPSGDADADRGDRVEVGGARQTPLGPSRPERIEIPAIGVTSELLALGLADDGTLAVPQPGPDLDKAAWFENSPSPGQPGPSIIEGHVSTDESGPSIFFDLARLRPGDQISVDRADGNRAVFEVTGLREFAKDRFPTELIYGGDVGTPTLRLITCSNFDPAVGSHTGNLVVFSELVRVVKA